MRVILGAMAACVVVACAGGAIPPLAMSAPAEVTAASPQILAALADERRPEADRARDAVRHPAEILAFANVQPGQRIADVGPGWGYYTRLFAVAVGDAGKVYAVNEPGPEPWRRAILPVVPAYQNVVLIEQSYQGWSAPEPLDTIFLSQIYHDFHLQGANRNVPTINRDLLAALKPGGALIVIDHAAVAGSDLSVADSLHRIDESIVRAELEAAGFVFEASSDVLRNPADLRTSSTFGPDVRGHTDQFVLRFRKPAA